MKTMLKVYFSDKGLKWALAIMCICCIGIYAVNAFMGDHPWSGPIQLALLVVVFSRIPAVLRATRKAMDAVEQEEAMKSSAAAAEMMKELDRKKK